MKNYFVSTSRFVRSILGTMLIVSLIAFSVPFGLISQSSFGSSVALAAYGSGGGGGGNGSGGGGGGSGGGEEVAGNNLSFPVIAADGFSITPIAEPTFLHPYTGPYTGLSAEELALLQGSDWYAQKTEGNVWQANYATTIPGEQVSVFGVDWGDNVESVTPVVGRPFRLEISLYKSLAVPMSGYTMALLSSPSSPNEAQGTNGTIYDSAFASVISPLPKMIVQFIGDEATSTLTWAGDKWVRGAEVPELSNVVFAPELNVGGKYIFGASEGGWRPTKQGNYRITMYFPGSEISLRGAVVGNFADWIGGVVSDEEARAAHPVVDQLDNLTYVDVTVSAGGGGSGGSGGEGDEGTGDTGTTTPEDSSGILSSQTGSSGGSSNSPYPGCVNPEASNYNRLANVDDGSCVVGDGEAKSASSGGGSGGTSGGSGSQGEVLGASTVEEPVAQSASSCKPYLRDYLKMGKNNDSEQVILLQKFLNETVSANLPLTGYFGSMTHDAVKKFQVAHHDTVLEPWNDPSLADGTGIVYITTLKEINSMKCATPG